MSKPHLLVCSSTKTLPVADAVQKHLDRHFEVTIWTQDLFDENNATPLSTFLRKLLCFDAAVLILGPDDVQVSGAGDERINVPRDNVIFELGATMARMGTKKTFLLTPEEPLVKLPTYFKGLEPLKYRSRTDNNLVAATGTACSAIRSSIERLEEDAFHSDLPAIGLAQGYFCNFIQPIATDLRDHQTLPPNNPWTTTHGYTVTVVLPNEVLTRDQVQKLMISLGLVKVTLTLRNGRDLSVYATMPDESKPLQLFDIPTTLLTSEKIITRVDNFWGASDRSFKELLLRREIIAFGRRVKALIREHGLDPKTTEVISIVDFQSRISKRPTGSST